MSLYVVNCYVLCTLMLLSVTEAGEYPGKNNFSGIYLHKCDKVRYVSEGVMNCIRQNVPKVERPEEMIVASTSQTEAKINGMCRANDQVTACVTTFFKDCPNEEEIMEGYLGRYLVCDENKPADWITQWTRVNSEVKITIGCGMVVSGSIGETIHTCRNPEWLDGFDWNKVNVTTGEQMMRRFIWDSPSERRRIHSYLLANCYYGSLTFPEDKLCNGTAR